MNKMMANVFSEVVNCRVTPVCPTMIRDSHHPPRGFYTEAQGSVSIMVVAKNPGPPFDFEKAIYRNASPKEVAERHLQFARDVFYNKIPELEGRRRIFHKRLKIYLRYLLDIDQVPLTYGDYDPVDIWKQAVYTNLVMCSFKGKSNQRLPEDTIEACFEHSFMKQVNFFKPSALLALDKRDVFEFLCRDDIKAKHGLPVLYVKHPSYPLGQSGNAILADLKAKIQRALGNVASMQTYQPKSVHVTPHLTEKSKTLKKKQPKPSVSRRKPQDSGCNKQRAPINSVNLLFQRGAVKEAITEFTLMLNGEYAYILDDSEPFVKERIIWIFSALANITTDFLVYHGPRRRTPDGLWLHPTFAISFNTPMERHFCDFKPKVTRDGYFKMTLPLPAIGFFDKLLRGLTWNQRKKSNYVDVRLYSTITHDQCKQLAVAANQVRLFYV